MVPLQSVAMGLVVLTLTAPFGGYDALPNPLGWVLVLLGVHALPVPPGDRRALLGTGLLAAAVSVPLWFPAVTESLRETDRALEWAVNLPQLGFTAVLCHVLSSAARAADDVRPARWLRTTLLLVVAVGVAPVLALGGGLPALEEPTYAAAAATALLLIGLLFAWSGRPWAGGSGRTATKSAPVS